MHVAQSATLRETSHMRLLRTSHLGPTLMVTLVSYLLALRLWRQGPSLLIALTVFCGQLVVGWTNDLVDLPQDQIEGRTNKPMVDGKLAPRTVTRATLIAFVLVTLLSLFGPMGFRGGFVHLLGVGSGVAYNFYFKSNRLSFLPYAISFAALPAAITLGRNISPPLWLLFCGAGLGVAAHFANVIKDMDRDRAAGIAGLPQIVGSKKSTYISGSLLFFVSIQLFLVTKSFLLLILGIIGIALLKLPEKFRFAAVMALAVLDVVALVAATPA
jgi:4-hydroxybenzoate polyprenyltransferase